MRKQLSVGMLLARTVLLPQLAVCTVCAGVQLLLFAAGLNTQAFLAEKSLENAIRYSRIPLAAAAGFVPVLVLCVVSCCSQQADRTVRRLQS